VTFVSNLKEHATADNSSEFWLDLDTVTWEIHYVLTRVMTKIFVLA